MIQTKTRLARSSQTSPEQSVVWTTLTVSMVDEIKKENPGSRQDSHHYPRRPLLAVRRFACIEEGTRNGGHKRGRAQRGGWRKEEDGIERRGHTRGRAKRGEGIKRGGHEKREGIQKRGAQGGG